MPPRKDTNGILAYKEVDHLNWAAKIRNAFLNKNDAFRLNPSSKLSSFWVWMKSWTWY
jgi:hypothetical protein